MSDLESRIEALPEKLRSHMRALSARPAVLEDPTVVDAEIVLCEKLVEGRCPACDSISLSQVSRKGVDTNVCSDCGYMTTLCE